jgi:16S rRNA C967 or C1407 C5-methylase (RsmB/RsmF family)
MQEKIEALPYDFVLRVRRELPEEFDAILRGVSTDRNTGFRLNRLIADHTDAVGRLRGEGIESMHVSGHPEAMVVDASQRESLLRSKVASERLIYVQNPASQIPPLLLDVEPSHRVMDMTAAPGSKTLQLAEMVGEAGELVALELVRTRFFRMNALLKEFGARSVRTILKNSMDAWRHRPEYFDRILLDAPCASEGRFNVHDEESLAYWTPTKTTEMVRKQRRLLYSGVQSLRPGGRLVYSTCSLSLDENEGVLSDVLTQFDGALEVEPPSIEVPAMRPARTEGPERKFHPSIAAARRIVPDENYEGFFVCVLRKTASTL